MLTWHTYETAVPHQCMEQVRASLDLCSIQDKFMDLAEIAIHVLDPYINVQ